MWLARLVAGSGNLSLSTLQVGPAEQIVVRVTVVDFLGKYHILSAGAVSPQYVYAGSGLVSKLVTKYCVI